MATAYLPRAADAAIEWALANRGCVRILGPRGVGKTRTATRHAARVYDMSNREQRNWLEEFASETLRRGPYPILIDEWQRAPDVLWEVKRVVDEGSDPGRFIVAGSPTWRPGDLTLGQWPLTARTIDVEMTPMSVAERHGLGGPTFLRQLFDGQGTLNDRFTLDGRLRSGDAQRGPRAEGIFDLLDVVQESGYPAHVGMPREEQAGDLTAVVNTVIGSDVQRSVDKDKLLAFLVANAAHSSKPVALEKLLRQANIARKTAESYLRIVATLGFTYTVGLWTGKVRGDALGRARRFFADPALCAHLAASLTEGPERDSYFRGALLETFVAAQLRAEVVTSGARFRLAYFRDDQGEVDLVIQDARTQSIACIEVKARVQATSADAAHIARVRDTLCGPANNGPRFAGGVVLHVGNRAGRLARSDDIVCLPMSALWSV